MSITLENPKVKKPHSESRLGTIGGTDISSIFGCNPWQSAFGLYQKIIGEAEQVKDNAAMKRGRLYEKGLHAFYEAKNGIDDVVCTVGSQYRDPDDELIVDHRGWFQSILVHDSINFLSGRPDYVYNLRGNRFGLEIKTADWSQRDQYDFSNPGNVQIPMHYYMQCQWYAGLAEVPRWDFIVGFFAGEEMKYHETCSFAFDQELYDMMVKTAVEFWETHVLPRKPPEDAKPAELETYYRKKFPCHIPKTFAERSPHWDEVVERILKREEQIKFLEQEQQLDKIAIISHFEDKEALETPFGNVTYKACKDSEVMKWQEYAEILEKCIWKIDDAWDEILDMQSINYFDEENGALYQEGIDTLRRRFKITKPGARRLLLPRKKGE